MFHSCQKRDNDSRRSLSQYNHVNCQHNSVVQRCQNLGMIKSRITESTVKLASLLYLHQWDHLKKSV